MQTIILIDFSWLYNKYYFVAKQKQGDTCSIVKSMLTQFLSKVNTSYNTLVYIVLDPPTKNTVNYSLNKAYKQQRDTNSKVEVYKCLPEVVKHLRINLTPNFRFVKAKHYEADQLIAYLTEKYIDRKVIIYSGDKDLLQLTYYPNTYVSNTFKDGSFVLLSDLEIYSKFSNSKKEDFTRISSNKKDILKYRGLKGDPSDNLPPLFPKIKDTEIQEIIKENVTSYSTQTFNHTNVVLGDMLTFTPQKYDGLFEFFKIKDMKFDEEAMAADIEKYGIYTADMFEPYGLSKEAFDAVGGKYFSVFVGRGILTFEEIII